MSFFGLSGTGKQDQGQIGALGNWANGQMTTDQQNSNQQYKNATPEEQLLNGFYGQNLSSPTGGGATTAQNWTTGQTVMPGVTDALATQQKNLGTEQNDFSNLESSPFGSTNTTNTLNSLAGSGIKGELGNTSNIGSDINSTFNNAGNTNNGLLNTLNTDIGGEFNNLNSNLTSAFGGMQNETNNTYDPLTSSAEGTASTLNNASNGSFGNSRGLMNLIMPGGQAQASQVAQSFAPQVASTMAALRQAGVNPNSPQAQQALESVQRGQAEGEDQALANSTNNYVSSGQNLNLQDLTNQENIANTLEAQKEQLGIGKLNTQLGLGTTAEGQQQANIQNEGALTQGAATNNANTNMGLDLSKLNSNTANSNNINSLLDNYYKTLQGNAVEGQNAGLQTFGTQANILGQNTSAAMNAPGFKYQQYQAGTQQDNYNTALKQAAAQGLTGQEAENYATALAYGSQETANNNQALKDYQTSLGVESQNAGWGTQLLGGLLGAGLNMVAPGAGTAVSGMVGGNSNSIPGFDNTPATSSGTGSPVDWGSGGVGSFAKGGVVTQPTRAIVGEGETRSGRSIPEAIIPLKTRKTADKLRAMNVLPKRDWQPLRRAA